MTKRLAVLLLLLLFTTAAARAGRFQAGSPATTNNADSCDIGPYPAATLLLPYFDVDVDAPAQIAETTLFTVTNVSQNARVVNVTLWSDYAYPVLSFPIFLTGYDTQAINLYDVLARGVLAPPNGTSPATPPGFLSRPNGANPNLAATVGTDCASIPRVLPPSVLADVRSGLTKGTVSACGTSRVGAVHEHAAGYVTIDSVTTCSPTLPTNERYFTELLAYENVLIGDYQQLNPNSATGNYAGGNPLVHIRAIPDGTAPTNLPYTFYDRLTPRNDRQRDRRQPLPSVFAGRFIQGGTGNFNTRFKIWREGAAGPTATCAQYAEPANQMFAEIVRFDEHENPTTYMAGITIAAGGSFVITLPDASSAPTSSWTFPPLSSSGDVSGWMYMNLAYTSPAFSVAPSAAAGYSMGKDAPRQSQSWVTTWMAAEGRYAVEFDAASLGNGCSPIVGISTASNGNVQLGPLPNPTP